MRVAFCHAPVEKYVRIPRGVCKPRHLALHRRLVQANLFVAESRQSGLEGARVRASRCLSLHLLPRSLGHGEPQEVCVVDRRGFRVAPRSGEDRPAHYFDGHCWMSNCCCSGTQLTGQTRRDADQEPEGSAMKRAERAVGLIMYISMDRPDLLFSSKTVMSTQDLEVSGGTSGCWSTSTGRVPGGR